MIALIEVIMNAKDITIAWKDINVARCLRRLYTKFKSKGCMYIS